MTRRTDELLQIAETVCTPKQVRVLRYWLNGHSNRRIGIALGIHEATVRGHLNAALTRMKPYLRKDAA